MHRISMAVLAATCLAFTFVPTASAHGGDGCNPGLLKSAEKHEQSALRQLTHAWEQFQAHAGGPAAPALFERYLKAWDRYVDATIDFDAHFLACV